MPEAISDTGPVLHLQEIGRLDILAAVAPLVFPVRVWEELEQRGMNQRAFQDAGLDFVILSARLGLTPGTETLHLQAADAEVFVLAQERRFEPLVLTDDLALRRLLEGRGATVAGSVGILVRAYTGARLSREELVQTIEALLEESSLHMSRAFREFVRKLVADVT